MEGQESEWIAMVVLPTSYQKVKHIKPIWGMRDAIEMAQTGNKVVYGTSLFLRWVLILILEDYKNYKNKAYW